MGKKRTPTDAAKAKHARRKLRLDAAAAPRKRAEGQQQRRDARRAQLERAIGKWEHRIEGLGACIGDAKREIATIDRNAKVAATLAAAAE